MKCYPSLYKYVLISASYLTICNWFLFEAKVVYTLPALENNET